MKKRAILLLATMATALLVASGVALAATMNCPTSTNCLGTNGNDTIYGSAGPDFVNAAYGNDYIYGYGGNDILNGYSGNDTIRGGSGFDTIYGFQGGDRLYGDEGVHDWMSGGTGNDYLSGGDGDDIIYGDEGADRYYDGPGKDYMRDSTNSLADAALGDDTYYGLRGGGYDTIWDSGGAFDTLDLSHLTTSQVRISAFDWARLEPDTNLDSLRIQRNGTTDMVIVRNYFDNTSAQGRGSGELKIKFQDRTVGFPARNG